DDNALGKQTKFPMDLLVPRAGAAGGDRVPGEVRRGQGVASVLQGSERTCDGTEDKLREHLQPCHLDSDARRNLGQHLGARLPSPRRRPISRGTARCGDVQTTGNTASLTAAYVQK